MKANQAICVNCGFNRETGKVLKTVEQKAVVVKEKRAKGGSRWAADSIQGASFGSIFLIAVVVQCGIAALGFIGPAALWGAWAFIGLIGFICWIWAISSAFIEGETMWAVCGICVIVPIVNIIAGLAFLYYLIFVCDNRVLKAIYLAYFVALVVMFFIAMSVMGDFMKSLPA